VQLDYSSLIITERCVLVPRKFNDDLVWTRYPLRASLKVLSATVKCEFGEARGGDFEGLECRLG